MKKIFLFLTICTFISSCTKENGIDGCTDYSADNYDINAEYNDGSCLYTCMDPYSTNYNQTSIYDICEYEADVVFSQDVTSATYFDDLGINWLDIYVETGPPVGTLQANLGFLYIPECYPIDDDAVHFTLLWENSQNTVFTWTVRDNSGQIHYSGTDEVLANNCLSMQLTQTKIQEYKQSTK